MRKLFLGLVAVGFIAIAPSIAAAQCCDSICVSAAENACPDPCTIDRDTVPLKSKRCSATIYNSSSDLPSDPVPATGGVVGCIQMNSPTGNGANSCIGGTIDSPTIQGCACVAGQCQSSGAGATCTEKAIIGCERHGKAIVEDNSAKCGFCPSTKGSQACESA